ncbi:FecR family protein [Desulfurispirillum indicum]|uniref:Uncharacterized protein n=1 Tax=Desulfurispirillum indicum (strain ATCC BAA-1389 / DSM 22839 / S5) TaxID=653733 RepID=E6W4U7_DESIS|nr:FecR domain-containing protein [Desulfurispirillum indicum]ADU64825.1 hypothetical protein Selin_0066 [Desulfurispirillum indicum S5]UCZ56759.1 FecR family protein [Desulfurispirillum indicum]
MRKLTILLFCIACLAATPAWAEEYEIGMVGAVEERSWAELGSRVRHLEAGSPIFPGEQIVTGRQGKVQILFSDNSHLAMGPSSRVHLQHYLYPHDTHELPGLHLVMLRGSFRFAPGEMALYFRDGIRLESPMAVAAVPGGMSGHHIQPGREQHFHLYQETQYPMEVRSKKSARKVQLDGVRNTVELSTRADIGTPRPMLTSEMTIHSDVSVGHKGRRFGYGQHTPAFIAIDTTEPGDEVIVPVKTDSRWLGMQP